MPLFTCSPLDRCANMEVEDETMSTCSLDRSPTLLAAEAFEYFYALDPAKREKNGFALAAKAFGVEVKKVKSWSTRFKWRMKTMERDKLIAARIEEAAIESAVSVKLDYHSKIRTMVRAWFEKRIGTGENDLLDATLTMMKPTEVKALMELDMTIMGSKDIQDHLNASDTDKRESEESVKALTTEQLRTIADSGNSTASSAVGIGQA
jgi:hypothetical protein